MMSSISRPRPRAKRSPERADDAAVTEYWKPYGLPMAMATWPTFTPFESPSVTHGRWPPFCVDAQQGEVRVGIVADDVRAVLLAV